MKTNPPCDLVMDLPAAPKAFRPVGVVMILGAVVALSSSLLAQTNLLMMDYQWADSLNGPWGKPSANETYVQPNGSLLALTTQTQKFFRLTIQNIGLEDVQSPAVQVEHLMPQTVSIAESHLRLFASLSFRDGSEAPSGNAWSNASLAPIAFKVFDPACKNGEEPAYIEFKVVSDFQPAEKPAEFLTGNETAPTHDLGHILVSLNEGDTPVPQFSEEGPTPCEELLRRVGNVPHLKIMRFGPTFATVENEQGEMLANAGTDPFKVPEDLLQFKNQTFNVEFDSDTAEEAPPDGYGGPKMAAEAYQSYADFKKDYLKNPVYQLMRERKARKVAGEWALLRGETLPEPDVLSTQVKGEVQVLPEEQITRVFFDDDGLDGQPLATVHTNPSGGLTITGMREGNAPLTVETPSGVFHFEFVIPPLIPPDDFTPGWQDPLTVGVSGGYNATPRYKQTLDYNLWCSKVGCGPVAWAILFGHWDRERGVPAAFYRNIPGDFMISDAPSDVSEKPAHLHDVYARLFDYCDVICSPFSQAGATLPGDMIEGGIGYLIIPFANNYLRFNSASSWDLMDPDWNEPSNRIRTALRNGRPAVVGLGWLWHYAVAYDYLYQVYKFTPDIVGLRRRWFKCNEGWGHEHGAWYTGNDTFLGSDIHPWQTTP